MMDGFRRGTRWVFLFIIVAAPVVAADPFDRQAAEILKISGVPGGLIVHVGCGDGRLTAALRANDRYQVFGLDRDAGRVRHARDDLLRRRRSVPLHPTSPGSRLAVADWVSRRATCETSAGLSAGGGLRRGAWCRANVEGLRAGSGHRPARSLSTPMRNTSPVCALSPISETECWLPSLMLNSTTHSLYFHA